MNSMNNALATAIAIRRVPPFESGAGEGDVEGSGSGTPWA
jgi:hypothetical protein